MPFRLSEAGGDLLRLGEGERDGGDLFRGFDGPGEYDPPGGGVGRRTADDRSAVDILAVSSMVAHSMIEFIFVQTDLRRQA